jgi:hypothetical protein
MNGVLLLIEMDELTLSARESWPAPLRTHTLNFYMLQRARGGRDYGRTNDQQCLMCMFYVCGPFPCRRSLRGKSSDAIGACTSSLLYIASRVFRDTLVLR